MMYLNWYLRYQTIDYDRVSLIFLLRLGGRDFTLKAFLTEKTSRDLWQLGRQSQGRRQLKN